MLELRIVAGMQQVPPASLIDILGPVQARLQLGEMVDAMIALLDTMDGDADCEDADPAEQDDHEGQCDEDGVNTAFDTVRYTTGASGPGCLISDPDCCVTDEPHDKAEEGDWEADRTWSDIRPVYGEDQSSPQRRQYAT